MSLEVALGKITELTIGNIWIRLESNNKFVKRFDNLNRLKRPFWITDIVEHSSSETDLQSFVSTFSQIVDIAGVDIIWEPELHYNCFGSSNIIQMFFNTTSLIIGKPLIRRVKSNCNSHQLTYAGSSYTFVLCATHTSVQLSHEILDSDLSNFVKIISAVDALTELPLIITLTDECVSNYDKLISRFTEISETIRLLDSCVHPTHL